MAGNINPAIANGFSIPYDTGFTVNGNAFTGILGLFGTGRLDNCLTEGQNFVRVTTTDWAMDQSGNLSQNTADVLDTSNVGINGFVQIDNSSPRIKLSGDANNIFAGTNTGDFVGGTNVDVKFKNYTISGGLFTADPFGGGLAGVCPNPIVSTA